MMNRSGRIRTALHCLALAIALVIPTMTLAADPPAAPDGEAPAAAPKTTVTEKSDSTVVERTTTVHEKTVTTKVVESSRTTPKAAIFVKNRAGKQYDDKVAPLEDLISSRVTDRGLSVISREDAANAVATFSSEGPNAGDKTKPGADLDVILSNNTSATRLAQSLGADFVLAVSIVAISHNVKHFEGYGVKRTIFESVIRVSFKILDRAAGNSISGGTAEATVKAPFQNSNTETDARKELNTYAERTGAVDDLLNEVSQKIAERIKVPEQAPPPPGMVKWTVIPGTTDMLVPEVIKDDNGEFVLSEHKLPVNPTNVTVELDGLLIGTAPGTFDAPPGIHKLRLTRAGYEDFERTVNVSNGQTLRIDMHMTEREYAKWKDMTAFLENLKAHNKLTDAQAERIRGYAQMLRQSGYKVDVKSDAKIDSKVDSKLSGTPKNVSQTALWW